MSSVSVSQVERNLRCELEDVKAKLQASKHLEDKLRAKLDAATEEVNRQKEEAEKVIIEKNDGVNMLKNEIEASNEVSCFMFHVSCFMFHDS